MRARARLQTDEAERQVDEPADKLVARYLDAHRDGAALVEADEMKGVLADVEADGSDWVCIVSSLSFDASPSCSTVVVGR